MSQNKTIKFFISSTFIDFIKERNALQNFVFPRLKKLCEENNFSFQPVDLRWGVTDESSEDNKTMEYCLNEVKRCSSDPKPNLLILFGQRYGWGPLPSYIEPDIFNIILGKIDDINFTKELLLEAKDKWLEDINKESVEEKKQKLQNEYNDALKYKFKNANLKKLLEEWYIQDLNDLDKKYYLKDKKNINPLIWRFIEKTLKMYIQKIEETKDKKYYDNFHTSATEQEIKLALKKQEDIKSQNTIVYSRKFKKGTLDKDFIEERETEKLVNLEEYLKKNNLCTKGLIDLDTYKSMENEYFSINTNSYEEQNYPKEMPKYLKKFCETIYSEFKIKIEAEIKAFNNKLATPLKIELDEQERFLKSKYYKIDKHVINNVIGRDNEVNNIVDFVTKSKNKEQYYLLYGKSGSGKTSVMAKALSDLKDKNSDFIALYRFIGTTANSTYSRQVFETLYWEIESILQNDKNIPKPNFEIEEREFKKQFKELLKKLDDKKVVLFLDAIDQFEDDNDLTIFLDELPSNFKIVFSVLYDENKTDNEDYTIYYNRLVNIKNIDNYKELDILDQNINIEILNSLLSKNNRTLSSDENNNQQAYVKEFIENQTPLCVKLTYEIVKEWTSTEQVDDLKNELPNIDSKNKEVELITKFFNNVIKKHYVKGELLNLTLGLISASKDGLSESELIDIISYEKEIVKSYDKNGRYQKLQRLPSSIFSKMYYHIQDIFTERLIDNILLINPYHRIVEETIEKLHYVESEKYFEIKKERNSIPYHEKLANYFKFSNYYSEKKQNIYYIRSLLELPYQLICSKNYKGFKDCLLDIEFISEVCLKSKLFSFLELIKSNKNKKFFNETIFELINILITFSNKIVNKRNSIFSIINSLDENSILFQHTIKIIDKKCIPVVKNLHQDVKNIINFKNYNISDDLSNLNVTNRVSVVYTYKSINIFGLQNGLLRFFDDDKFLFEINIHNAQIQKLFYIDNILVSVSWDGSVKKTFINLDKPNNKILTETILDTKSEHPFDALLLKGYIYIICKNGKLFRIDIRDFIFEEFFDFGKFLTYMTHDDENKLFLVGKGDTLNIINIKDKSFECIKTVNREMIFNNSIQQIKASLKRTELEELNKSGILGRFLTDNFNNANNFFEKEAILAIDYDNRNNCIALIQSNHSSNKHTLIVYNLYDEEMVYYKPDIIMDVGRGNSDWILNITNEFVLFSPCSKSLMVINLETQEVKEINDLNDDLAVLHSSEDYFQLFGQIGESVLYKKSFFTTSNKVEKLSGLKIKNIVSSYNENVIAICRKDQIDLFNNSGNYFKSVLSDFNVELTSCLIDDEELIVSAFINPDMGILFKTNSLYENSVSFQLPLGASDDILICDKSLDYLLTINNKNKLNIYRKNKKIDTVDNILTAKIYKEYYYHLSRNFKVLTKEPLPLFTNQVYSDDFMTREILLFPGDKLILDFVIYNENKYATITSIDGYYYVNIWDRFFSFTECVEKKVFSIFEMKFDSEVSVLEFCDSEKLVVGTSEGLIFVDINLHSIILEYPLDAQYLLLKDNKLFVGTYGDKVNVLDITSI